MAHPMQPIINMNGSTRESHVHARIEAVRAIKAALEALREIAPHGRDYPGDSERYERDRATYVGRYTTLRGLIDEIDYEAMQIHAGEPV